MQKSMTKIIKDNKGLFIGGASVLVIMLVGLIFLLAPKNTTGKKVTQANETKLQQPNKDKKTEKTSESTSKDSAKKDDKTSDDKKTSPNENNNQAGNSDQTVAKVERPTERAVSPSQSVSTPVVKKDEASVNQPIAPAKQTNPTNVPVSTTQTTTKQVVQEQPKPQSVPQPTVNPENEPLKINGTVWTPQTPWDKVFYSEEELLAYEEQIHNSGVAEKEGWWISGYASVPSNKNGGVVWKLKWKKIN